MRELPKKQKEAVKLYQSGVAVSEIATRLNSSYSSIYTWLKRNKVQFRRNDGVNITKRFLIEELEKNRTLEEIAEVSNTTINAVQKALMRHGLDTETLWAGKEALNWIHPLQEQLLYGSLLGDAYIEIHHGSGRIKFEHGVTQREYCQHKYEVMKNFVNKTPIIQDRLHPVSKKVYTSISFRTKSLKMFTDIHALFYQGKTKFVSPEALGTLDDRGLTYWFQDDGYRDGNCLGIATNSFTDSDRTLICDWFKARWEVTPYTRDGRVRFEGVNAYKLEKIVLPNIREEFRYKLI